MTYTDQVLAKYILGINELLTECLEMISRAEGRPRNQDILLGQLLGLKAAQVELYRVMAGSDRLENVGTPVRIEFDGVDITGERVPDE